LDLAELYLELNLSAEAGELAQQGTTDSTSWAWVRERKCLAFSAMAASQIGRAFEGLKRFADAREIFVREKNHAWPSLIDLYRALVFFNEGRFFEARRHCADALDAFDALKLNTKAVMAHLLLARIAVRTDEPEQSMHTPRQRWENWLDWRRRSLRTRLTFFWAIFSWAILKLPAKPDEAYASYQTARLSLKPCAAVCGGRS